MKEDFAEQCLHKDFPNIATLKQGLVHGVLTQPLSDWLRGKCRITSHNVA